jgi:hypothetical protein
MKKARNHMEDIQKWEDTIKLNLRRIDMMQSGCSGQSPMTHF